MAVTHTTTKSFVLTEREIAHINRIAQEKNISASSALRLIVNEWADLQVVRVPIVGTISKRGNVIFKSE